MESRPIKIVRIIGRLNIGGPAIHAVLLTEGLNDAKTCSILVTGTVGKNEGDMLYFATQHGVSPIIIPELGREISWREDFIALWKLFKILRKERPDIVHTHTSKAGTLGRLAAILARVPIRIHTFHGHFFHGYFGRFKTGLLLFVERMLAHFTTRIIAISEAQLVDLSCRYRVAAREKFALVPIGLDLAALIQIQRTGERGCASGGSCEVQVGFVGRLVPIKNPQMALRVFAKLLQPSLVRVTVHFVIAGDGELKAELEAQVIQLGLRERVKFIGWQSDAADLYARLDMVALTSLNEGTPLVLIEAMASALPFVCTRVGGVSDLVFGPEEIMRHDDGRPLFSLFANGALVESGDEEGFGAAIRFLLNDRERMRRMGQAGREFVGTRFSKERLVRDIQALYYEECLMSKSGSTLSGSARSVHREEIHSLRR